MPLRCRRAKPGTKEAFYEACLCAVDSLTVQSQDRTLNEQEKRQVLDTIENQDGQVGTDGNFSVDAIRHKDDEVFIDGALCVTLRKVNLSTAMLHVVASRVHR